MTGRERVLAAMGRRPHDRPPTTLRCTPEVWVALRERLGVGTNDEVLDALDVDLRWIALPYAGPRDRATPPWGGEGKDYWGCRFRRVTNEYNTYYELEHSPLAAARSVEEVEELAWPDLDWWDYDAMPGLIERAKRAGDRAILFFAGGAFETPWYLRGFERFLMDLVEDPPLAEAICRRVARYFRDRALRVLEACAGTIDVVGSGGDLGGQTGMLVDPASWRASVKPHAAELISTFSRMGLKTYYHSDGSIVPVIDDLIGMGLDTLEPIQVTAAGMSPEELFPRFGDRLCFSGAIDEVDLLPRATAAEVRAETTRVISILGGNHGYIVAPCHQVQGDTPVDNVLALIEAARSYDYGKSGG